MEGLDLIENFLILLFIIMSEESIQRPEEGEKSKIGVKREAADMEAQKNTNTEMPERTGGMEKVEELEEKILPEQKEEIEKRKEIVERQKEEIKKEEKLPEEEQETVNHILEEAKKAGPMFSTPDNEMIADRLVRTVIEGRQKLNHVLRAVEQFGDPFLFDKFRDKLTEDENWKKLEELGEI